MKKTISNRKTEENTKGLRIMRDNFIFLRQRKGWSVQELSEISGIAEKILTNIEKGKDFEVQYLFKLCYIYHIKPHQIFSDITVKF